MNRSPCHCGAHVCHNNVWFVVFSLSTQLEGSGNLLIYAKSTTTFVGHNGGGGYSDFVIRWRGFLESANLLRGSHISPNNNYQNN